MIRIWRDPISARKILSSAPAPLSVRIPAQNTPILYFITGDTAYVAGISGLQQNSFTKVSANYTDQYELFYHTTSAWNDVVIDAEKSANRSWDAHMCWAATDSNLLYRTGWLTSSTLTVDDVFDKY